MVSAAHVDATDLIKSNDVISVTVIDHDGFQLLAGLRDLAPSTSSLAPTFKPSASELARDEAKQRAKAISEQAALELEAREAPAPLPVAGKAEVADKKWVKSRAHSFVTELMECVHAVSWLV